MLRSIGVAALGLFLGLFAGGLLTGALARPFVGADGHISPGVGVALGSITPVLGIVGAVAAVLIDRHSRGRP